MDYAGVAMRGVEAAPFGGRPGHLPLLHPHALLIDAQEAFPGVSRADRNDLFLKDLAVPAGEVLGVYTVPATQLLRVNFRSFEPFVAALAKLRRGGSVDGCRGSSGVWTVNCGHCHAGPPDWGA